MSSAVRLTVVGDGSSDRCMEPIIQWILDQEYRHIPYALQYASNLPPARNGLRGRILAAVRLFPCDILVVHRDAERATIASRTDEVACEARGISEPCIPAIPVKMIEAWLLFDVKAIRRAANNPHGVCELDIPPNHRWEEMSDPKEELFAVLRTATELHGRRLEKFNVHEARFRLSTLIQDFGQLSTVPAFQVFRSKLLAAMAEVVAARIDSSSNV